jgi:hypothetical protein
MPSAMNVDTDLALESIDVLANVPADLLLPGHGEPWWGDLGDAVEQAHRAGRS